MSRIPTASPKSLLVLQTQSVTGQRSKSRAIALVVYLLLAAVATSLPRASAQDAFVVPEGHTGKIDALPLIRPANFDPRDPGEYTRLRGVPATGMTAHEKIWNQQPLELATNHAVLDANRSIAAAAGGNQPGTSVPELAAPASAASGSEPHISPYRMTYQEAFSAIPFSRAEYEANPAYRHEAAMELMFGALRPMTNIKQTTPYFSRYPDLYRYRYPVFPYPGGSGGGDRSVFLYWNSFWPY